MTLTALTTHPKPVPAMPTTEQPREESKVDLTAREDSWNQVRNGVLIGGGIGLALGTLPLLSLGGHLGGKLAAIPTLAIAGALIGANIAMFRYDGNAG